MCRQAMNDASERNTAAGGLLSHAAIPAELRVALRIVVEGLQATRVVREHQGLSLGPDLPDVTGSAAVTTPTQVTVGDQQVTAPPGVPPATTALLRWGHRGWEPSARRVLPHPVLEESHDDRRCRGRRGSPRRPPRRRWRRGLRRWRRLGRWRRPRRLVARRRDGQCGDGQIPPHRGRRSRSRSSASSSESRAGVIASRRTAASPSCPVSTRDSSSPASSCGCTVKQPTGPSSTSPPVTPTGAAWPTDTS